MRKLSFLLFTFISISFTSSARPVCKCDTASTAKLIKRPSFNRINRFDSILYTTHMFYNLSESDNRRLWFRDVENPDPTLFTKYWDDYEPNNYHASNSDFIEEYKNRQDIELAFQFGPYMDLWAYWIFVVRKIDCCYLITKSYFRHARFTSKSYAIVDGTKIDSVFSIIGTLNKRKHVENGHPSGAFANNRTKENFYIDFELDTVQVIEPHIDSGEYKKPGIYHVEAKPEIKSLYQFIDTKIPWIKTYSL